MNETVHFPHRASRWRRWFAITGPALMVSVGYMDPGNWATDLAGGSRYNYLLIWVLLMSNLMAVLLQSLAIRLGIASRRDLAQACRETYPPWVNIPLYILAEIAITATDLAEVIGSAIALQLLFGLPLLIGVCITGLDVLLLLTLSHFGIRRMEAFVFGMVSTIGIGFLVEIILAKPEWGGIIHGFVPSLPDSTALYIAIGILGATVMPHNLYLHSALVQTRRVSRSRKGLWSAIRSNNVDSALALNLAFFVNAAILIMSAAVFYRAGHHDVAEIQDAHRLLEPILGVAIAPIAFAIALLASGQSSTITGTLAGQIVMEGYLHIRIRPWLRRLITRLLAIIPAVLVILYFGDNSTGSLLVLSQVVLSLQLPFAIIPLIHFAADRRRMGEFAVGRIFQAAAWCVAGIIVVLNIKLVADEGYGWIAEAGSGAWKIKLVLLPLAAAVAFLLLYVTLMPVLSRLRWMKIPIRAVPGIHDLPTTPQITLPQAPPYRCVAIGLDFSGGEEHLLAEALRLLGPRHPRMCLLHVVESPAAHAVGQQAADLETDNDRMRLEAYAQALLEQGVDAHWRLGSGDPVKELVRMLGEAKADLLILGAHRHRGVSDLIHGATADALRHSINVPVLLVPTT